MVAVHDRSRIEVETGAVREGGRVTVLPSLRGSATLPRVRKCSCDGSGWLVVLDRDRYRSPGHVGMLRLTRCLCLEYAPGPAGRGGAGAC